jgi:O-antigen ligase
LGLLTAGDMRELAPLPQTARALPIKPAASLSRPLLQALPICVVILAGMALGSGALSTAGALGAWAAAIISPPAGLAILAFMTPLKSPVLAAPGFNTFLVGAILLGCVYRLPIDRPNLRPSLALLLLLAFTLYVAVQQLPELAAGYPGPVSHHIGYLFIQFSTLAAVAVAAAYVTRGRAVAPFLAASLLGAVVAAILTIAVYVLPAGPLANLVVQPEPGSRVVGPFGDPNYFGLFQATAISAALAMYVIARSRRVRLLLAGTLIVLGIAFAIALSRAALVALAAGVVTLAFTRSRRTGLLAVLAVAVFVFVVYPVYLQLRLLADAGALPATQAALVLERSDASRLAAALAGPQMFMTSPVFGIGFGQYPLMSGRYTGYPIESHNWYMNVLAEQGLVGVLLWVPMLAAITRALVRATSPARSVGLAVFVTYAVGSVFLQPPYSVQTSAFAVIVVVTALAGSWSQLAATGGAGANPAEWDAEQRSLRRPRR